MKRVSYTADAARQLRRHGNMAFSIRKALNDYAGDPKSHANNVTHLVGSNAKRMRVGDFRVIFVETEAELLVTKVAPRGRAYE